MIMNGPKEDGTMMLVIMQASTVGPYDFQGLWLRGGVAALRPGVSMISKP